MPAPQEPATASGDRNLALFCDFENIALGVRDSQYADFDMRRVVQKLLVKGSIVVKKAYCDWERYKGYKKAMHEAAFELMAVRIDRLFFFAGSPQDSAIAEFASDVSSAVELINLGLNMTGSCCLSSISDEAPVPPRTGRCAATTEPQPTHNRQADPWFNSACDASNT